MLDELRALNGRIVADAEALPQLGSSVLGTAGSAGQSRRETLPTATSRFWTEYQKSLPSPLVEASSVSCNAIIANWHWRSTSVWKCRIRIFSIGSPPSGLAPTPRA